MPGSFSRIERSRGTTAPSPPRPGGSGCKTWAARELRAAVEPALISDDGDGWDEAEPAARAWFDATIPFRDAREHMLRTWERAYLHDLVRRVGMDLSAAARTARVDRSFLRALLRRHGLSDAG